jgi:hypothetical protein
MSSNQGSNGGSNPNGSGNGGYTLPPAGSGSNPSGGGQQPAGGTTPSADNNCGVQKIDLKAGPADLLLVLDRSGSMRQDVNGVGPGGTGGGGRRRGGMTPTPTTMGPAKWDQVVAAVDPVVMATQDKVNWGLKLFPLGDTCGVPDGATVPVGPANYNAVLNAIMMNGPGTDMGGTPTRVAIEKATAFMKGRQSGNSPYLVLATDGLPNCLGGFGGGGNANDATGAVQAIAAAAMAGIPTFVVGIATTMSDANDTLNAMAVQGGRARNDPAVKYYPVASKDELVSVLQSITSQIASCTFPLTTPPPIPDNVAVQLDGTSVPRDMSQANGWNYSPDNHSVVLFGAPCDGLKAGTAMNVQILYGCPGRMVE